MSDHFKWDWSKLPTSEYSEVFKAYDTYDHPELLHFYVKYRLGKAEYCCPKSFLRDFYSKAIETGELIRPE